VSDLVVQRLKALARELGGSLLAIDTSGSTACVCRVDWGVGVVDEESFAAAVNPSEAIGRALARAIEAHPGAIKRLKGIVIGIGPGSFTGLRVGLALAKGMAYAGHVPLYGVSSLAVLAASQDPGLVALCLEARRGEVFAAVYEVTVEGTARALVQDHLTTPERFGELLQRHPAARLVGGVGAGSTPATAAKPLRVALSLLLAGDRLRRGIDDDVVSLVPSYLKVSEAERTTT
jgi:tRNA threonylcarbamoyladenosine biosynthesis protein TsaB